MQNVRLHDSAGSSSSSLVNASNSSMISSSLDGSGFDGIEIDEKAEAFVTTQDRELKVRRRSSTIQLNTVDGFQSDPWLEFRHWILAVFTGGMSLLFAHWFPLWYVPFRFRRVELEYADLVLAQDLNGAELVPVEAVEIEPWEEKELTCGGLVAPPLSPGSSLSRDNRMIVFRHTRFLWHTESAQFLPLLAFNSMTARELELAARKGLNAKDHSERLEKYGRNVINVIVKSWVAILLQEVFQPFFVFQIYSVVLWCCEEYYIFAGAIFGMASASVITTLIETRNALISISRLARYECPVRCLRDGETRTLSSIYLVPGDVIEITNQMTLPCDLALLKGACVVDEGMLTGESVPVVKSFIDFEGQGGDGRWAEKNFNLGTDPRTTLFAATRVLQLKPRTKGDQSFKFVGSLFVLALIGFAITVWQLEEQKAAIKIVIVRGLDLITIVVPPTLPLAMSVGTNFALVVLRRLNIFCISPSRINMAGKVKLMCFDKTGTLTSEGMDMMGVRPARGGVFDPLTDLADKLPLAAVCTMSSCHTLASVDDQGLIGDPLELKIFDFTGAQMKDGDQVAAKEHCCQITGKDGAYVVSVRTQFEFQSVLQRMSVLAENNRSAPGVVTSYVKGSPELIKTLCTADSLPDNYDVVLNGYVKMGFRVIALGYREFTDKELSSLTASLSKDELREVVESHLTFAGFVMLENKLKSETAPTLRLLRQARVRCVMVTGDNPLTAVTVAKECQLVDPDTAVFMSKIVDHRGSREVQWVHTDDDTITLDPVTLRVATASGGGGNKVDKYELALTGDAFEFLYKFRSDRELANSFFHKVILSGQIFARMTPAQKALLVSELQLLGMYVGMCGDGANDCGALKTAHVGVSLSQSEASIAAPFTYTKPNIECIPVLLREGRASLVTSFQLFRFMAMYSMIQFMAVILLYFKGSVLGNWQYLYQDLWLVFPLTVLMGSTLSAPKLSVKRPSGNLLSPHNVLNVLTHLIVVLLFQVLVFLLTPKQDGYEVLDNPDDGAGIWETTCLYWLSNFQYIIMALLLALGRPWKRLPYTNPKFTCWYLMAILCSLLIVLTPNDNVFLFGDDISAIGNRWRWLVLLIVAANAVVAAGIELVVYPVFLSCLRVNTGVGSIFGRGGRRSGGLAPKPYHALRQSFEAGWNFVASGTVDQSGAS